MMEYAEGGSLYNGMFLFSALQTGKILLVIICKKFCNTLQILSCEVNVDSAQKESRFPTGRISLHCNGVDECGQIISTVLCLQWL